MGRLQELLNDHLSYHSQFQQDYFITGLGKAGNTAFSQYKQSLRELNSRYRALKDLYASRELLQIDIEELQTRMKKPFNNEFDKRRKQIKLTRKYMTMEDLNKTINDMMLEFNRFYQHANALKNRIESQVGPLDQEKYEKLEKEMWEVKIKSMAAMDFIVNNHIGQQTMDMIMSLPLEDRNKMLRMVKSNVDKNGNPDCSNQIELMKWFETYKNELDDVQLLENQIDTKEIVALIEANDENKSDNTDI